MDRSVPLHFINYTELYPQGACVASESNLTKAIKVGYKDTEIVMLVGRPAMRRPMILSSAGQMGAWWRSGFLS